MHTKTRRAGQVAVAHAALLLLAKLLAKLLPLALLYCCFTHPLAKLQEARCPPAHAALLLLYCCFTYPLAKLQKARCQPAASEAATLSTSQSAAGAGVAVATTYILIHTPLRSQALPGSMLTPL